MAYGAKKQRVNLSIKRSSVNHIIRIREQMAFESAGAVVDEAMRRFAKQLREARKRH